MSFPRSTGTPADPGGASSREATDGFVLGPDDGDPYWAGHGVDRQGRCRSDAGQAGHRRAPRPCRLRSASARATDQDEVFYVVDGRLTVTCGDKRWQAGAGSLVFLPRAVPHGFSVFGEDPARILLINAPAGFAEVITELGDPATSLTLPGPDVPVPDGARIAAVSEAHGIRSV